VPATGVGGGTELLPVFADTLLQLGSEVADQTLDGPGESLTQGTDGVALDLLGQLLEHVDLTLAGVAGLHALHHLHGPLATLAAGGALTTRLVLVEGRQAGDGANNVGRLVHDDDGRGTQTSLVVLERVKVHELVVSHGLRDDGSRRATGNDGVQVVPTAAHTTAVLLNQFAQRDGHLLLDGNRVVDVTGDTEQLGTGVTLTAEGGEPAGPATDDGRDNGDGLDIGDGARATEKTDGSGERGLETGLASLTLNGLDQGSLLAANVGTHTAVDVDVEIIAGPARVLADVARGVGLVDSALENGRLMVELATNVDVGGIGVHGTTHHQATLNQLLGVLAHNLAILASTGLAFICVNNQITGPGILVPVLEVHERLSCMSGQPENQRPSASHCQIPLTYFNPEGKPAPPRPRRPEALISEMSCSGSISNANFRVFVDPNKGHPPSHGPSAQCPLSGASHHHTS